MRRLALVLLLIGASSAYASVVPGTFNGYVTSLEKVTAPNTYTDAFGTLSNRSLSGYAGWFAIALPPQPDNCNIGSNYLECGPYACGGYNYIGIQWSGGAISPQFDSLSGPGNYDEDCQLGDAQYSWGGGGVTGFVEALDTGVPNVNTVLYEGITLNFEAPAIPGSAPWLVDPNYWSGSGSFWYTQYGADGSVEAGYQGTFSVVPAPEPGTLALFLAGAAGIAISRRRRWHKAGRESR